MDWPEIPLLKKQPGNRIVGSLSDEFDSLSFNGSLTAQDKITARRLVIKHEWKRILKTGPYRPEPDIFAQGIVHFSNAGVGSRPVRLAANKSCLHVLMFHGLAPAEAPVRIESESRVRFSLLQSASGR
jgi:hypothetical protein